MSVHFGDDTFNPNIESPSLDASIAKPEIKINFNAPALGASGNGTVIRSLVNPEFFIGTVETLQPGEDVYCYLTGTRDHPVLNFGIPMGYTGANGQDGADGTNGADGITPTTTVTSITGGHNVAFDYGVSDPRNTDFNVMDGVNGTDGTNGQDGVSPAVTIGTITGGHSVKITDKDHPTGQTFNVMDGTNGSAGAAATIAVGTVTTGLPTDPAAVTNVGTSSAAVFDFTIPKGDKGDTGATGPAGTMPYAVCSTAAATATKEVTIAGITELVAGLTVNIKFTNANSVASPTLKINTLTAKPIYQYGTTAVSTTAATTGWQAGAVVQLTYDGTGFVRDQGYNTNTTYTVTEVYCGTGATTAAKVSSNASYYVLRAGNIFEITFRYTNTKASALTLNVNGTGAKPIYIDGVASSATNYNIPAGKYICYYDGTNYYINTNGKAPINITGKADGNHDIPAGGASGYVLKKSSATDYDVAWAAESGGGGGISDVKVDGTSVVTGGVAEVDLTGKADAVHTHVVADVTDFPSIPAPAPTTGATPSSDTASGSVGTSTNYARADHRHTGNFKTSGLPEMDGTAARGTDSTYAHFDHVHPTDTSRAATDGTNISAATFRKNLGLGDADGALPLTDQQGGTGMTGVLYTTSISSIMTPGTNVTITEASLYRWGHVAQLFVILKSSASIGTTSVTVATMVAAYRPFLSTAIVSTTGNAMGYISGETGDIKLTRGAAMTSNIAANTSLTLRATFIY